LDFFSGSNGCDWEIRDGWFEEDDVCDWYGITCESVSGSNEITSINLPWNNLSGSISDSITDLVYVERLDFSHNLLDGSIPTEFGLMRSLGQLFLADNAWTHYSDGVGVITDDMCQNTNMVITADCNYPFSVDVTSVTVSPCVICTNTAPSDTPSELPSVTPSDSPSAVPVIEPSGAPSALPSTNPATLAPTCDSSIDRSVCDGYSLQSTCEVLIDVYESMGGCSWVAGSAGSRRHLSGTAWFSGTIVIGSLDPFCNWTGITCEEDCTESCDVTKLDLSYNNVRGTIPSKLGTLFKLTSIELTGNSLYGEIPSELLNLPFLAVLTLDDNDFDNQTIADALCADGRTWSRFVTDCDQSYNVVCSCCTSCGDMLAPSIAPSDTPSDTPSSIPSDTPSSMPSS
jgi:hypothetical protein